MCVCESVCVSRVVCVLSESVCGESCVVWCVCESVCVRECVCVSECV